MVAFNVTVEDTSPLINYSPLEAWIDVLPNDTLANAASRRSLRTTRTAGAKATISFNGTGISVYGIDTAGFGDYAVTVDGRDIRSEAGSRSQNTKRLLGSAYGLSNGPHTAILTSSGSDPVNVDYMDVQHEAAGSLMSMASIDDSDPRVVYQPLSEWQTNTDPDFMNGTLQ
ncbi:hypothetical protein PQX77_001172 [Marasmius sp. AFHP31]|nr:hypothetical protein PQX77_001172 [Marasmius sp. AFHP31]